MQRHADGPEEVVDVVFPDESTLDREGAGRGDGNEGAAVGDR